MATLYGIGVGPGDFELLTIKAARIIEDCDVVVAPSAEDGGVSIALETAKKYIKIGTEVITKHFPMRGDNKKEKVEEIYKLIESKLKEGKNVSFLTIGDPYVYSTYIHLLTYIKDSGFNVETIPGITSFCAAASIVNRTLVVGDEPLLIIPGSRVSDIKDEKYVVIMKMYKHEEKIIEVLEEKGFDYIYITRAGRDGQKILKDKKEILQEKDYMSLILASKE